MTILGFLSLLASNLWSTEAGVRRKPHLILRGTVVGVGPIMLLLTPMIAEGVKTPLCYGRSRSYCCRSSGRYHRIRRREALRSRNPRSAVSLDNIRSGEDGGAPGLRDIY